MNSSTKVIDRRLAAPAPVRLAARIALAAAFALAPAVMPARAVDVVITSQQEQVDVIGLGLVDFTSVSGNPRAVPFNPGDVVAGDLDFSARFRLQRAPVLTPVAKARFMQEGAQAYVRGDYALEGGRFTLNADLVDLSTGDVLLRKKYGGPTALLRKAAHQFSDEVVNYLFAEKGIAQTRIAYVNRRGGAKEIWSMDYDGAGAGAATRAGGINMNPVFMGTKDKVVFSSYAKGAPQLYATDTDAPNAAPLFMMAGMNSAPAYNRMDREVAWASTANGNSEIYRRGVAGGKSERLTFSASIETSPSWSPNGYELVFMSDRAGQPQLYIMDRDGSNTRRLTYDFAYCGSPSWSPKGDRIAFAAMDDGNNLNIYTIAPDGSGAVRLTSGGSNESPTWSPDGRHIAFTSTRTGSSEIYAMRADGSEVRRLTYSGSNMSPSWSDF